MLGSQKVIVFDGSFGMGPATAWVLAAEDCTDLWIDTGCKPFDVFHYQYNRGDEPC
jgi:hypothetical protein